MTTLTRCAALLLFLPAAGLTYAQAPPTASFTFDSLKTAGSMDYCLYYTDNSTGATSVEYRIHNNDIAFPLVTTTLNNGWWCFGSPGLSNLQMSQIVTNANGADTSTINVTINCSNLTPPFALWYNVNITGGNNVNVTVGQTVNYMEADMNINGPGGSWSSVVVPSLTFTAPCPGTYSVFSTHYWGTCPLTNHSGTFTVPCWGPPTPLWSATGTLFNWSFSDTTTMCQPFTRLWDFGDGTTSALQAPSHTYAQAGWYQVCLTRTDSCGTGTTCDSILVQCPAPQPGFNHVASSAPGAILFTNTSTSPSQITGYSWDFGDGTTSSGTNPMHTYSAIGTYNVCLTVYAVCDSATFCQPVTVPCRSPLASFSHNTSGATANFTDLSTSIGPGQSWAWNFGDGGTSTAQSPSHTYATTGTYQVCLIVTDSCGSASICQGVSPCVPPTAAFQANPQGLYVPFLNQSSVSGTSTYSWDFGDGNTSTVASPAHTYAAAGSYYVCLTVTDACGTHISCDTLTVCATLSAAFHFSVQNSTVDFQNWTIPINGTTFHWDFGNGDTSALPHPTYTYAAPGNYTVCLVATDACGTDSSCQTVSILSVGTSAPASALDAVLLPNPNAGQLRVKVQWPYAVNATLSIVDIAGKRVQTQRRELDAGSSVIDVLHDLAEGLYFLEISDGHYQLRRKMLVQR